MGKIYKERKYSNAPKLKFIIVGDGNLRTGLETEVDKLGIRDIVLFLGNRNDSDLFYSGLDIVALTSLNEGTPLSLIEAMANGKAVISTSVGGVVDLIGGIAEEREGFKICERGISVASNDSDALFNGLIYLAKDENLREKLGANGREFVKNNYSKERLIKDITNLYRDLNQK